MLVHIHYATATSPEWADPDPDSVRPQLLPDLTGEWTSSTGETFTLRLHTPSDSAATPPHSMYAREGGHCRLHRNYGYESRELISISIKCDGLDDGILHPDGQEVQREGGPTWSKTSSGPLRNSSIHTVHMVFMNHYDVGYTSFINDVDNTYMHEYFPLAANTAEEMRNTHSKVAFIYTTHAWLMQRYLQCPKGDCLAKSLNNNFSKPLQCPTQAEVEKFTAAAKNGDIAWHAGPFNWQPENMSPALFDAGIDLVRAMDEMFYNGNKNTTTMSVRDVIYVTRSVIPYLAKRGITGLTIGSNGADFPPQVPTAPYLSLSLSLSLTLSLTLSLNLSLTLILIGLPTVGSKAP